MSVKVEGSRNGVEVAEFKGRAVLQPACNRETNTGSAASALGKEVSRKSIKTVPLSPKSSPKNPPSSKIHSKSHVSPPTSPSTRFSGLLTGPSKNASPKIYTKPMAAPPKPSDIHPSSPKESMITSPRPKPSSVITVLKRANDAAASLNTSVDKQNPQEAKGASPKASPVSCVAGSPRKIIIGRKKPRKANAPDALTRAPGSLAAARKAEISERYAQRKMRISHYGRKQGSPKAQKTVTETASVPDSQEIRRCSFITSQSDPVFVSYHDQEWGVPVHDDKMLFEILVLMGAQVGMNWPTILRKRENFREAFAGFDPAIVATFNEKKIASINAEYGIMDIPKIRGIVENAKQILEIVKEFGSFDKYIWGFVNFAPIVNKYKYARNVPVKTSKAETISKDMVKRSFRFVGPTIMHSFMQAAGLTNDHLVDCFRHEECIRLSQQCTQDQNKLQ